MLTTPKRRSDRLSEKSNYANIIIVIVVVKNHASDIYHWITRSVSPSLGGK